MGRVQHATLTGRSVKILLRARGLLGDDGVLEGLPADEALERQVLIVAAHLVVLVV